ncbi:MAG: hypothetical protein ACI9K5_003013 [Gammaproteobacteria bacterium]|jgi:hypothetical protein
MRGGKTIEGENNKAGGLTDLEKAVMKVSHDNAVAALKAELENGGSNKVDNAQISSEAVDMLQNDTQSSGPGGGNGGHGHGHGHGGHRGHRHGHGGNGHGGHGHGGGGRITAQPAPTGTGGGVSSASPELTGPGGGAGLVSPQEVPTNNGTPNVPSQGTNQGGFMRGSTTISGDNNLDPGLTDLEKDLMKIAHNNILDMLRAELKNDDNTVSDDQISSESSTSLGSSTPGVPPNGGEVDPQGVASGDDGSRVSPETV